MICPPWSERIQSSANRENLELSKVGIARATLSGMNDAADTHEVFDVDTALAAMAVFELVRFRWERVAIAFLAAQGRVSCTRSGWFKVPGVSGRRLTCQSTGFLNLWAIGRLVEWGVIEQVVEYDPAWPPQSFSDAPITFRGWKVTDLGRALAHMIGQVD